MKKKIIFISIIILLLLITYRIFMVDIKDYFLKKHVIFWTKDSNIEFKNYKAEPNFQSESNISYFHGFYLKSHNIKDATVRAYFDTEKSWIKDTTKFNVTDVKKLQKIRFDLYEGFARKFNREIDKVRNDESKSFSDIENIGDEIYSELKIVENQIYESDLTIGERVKYWRPKIDSILNLKK